MLKPDDIMAESFRIIEAEVGAHTFDMLEWPVVRRIIHASGDLELTAAVSFHGNAVRAGIEALQQGTPIVSDVRMVATGIRQQLLADLGSTLHCFIDVPEVQQIAHSTGRTRSYCAMQKAIADVGTAVYVIGNAPTALMALCQGVRQGLVQPRLIVAMPVGFVSVVESKEEALMLDVPVITMRGRKGGSAVAAATMNALLLLAQQGLA